MLACKEHDSCTNACTSRYVTGFFFSFSFFVPIATTTVFCASTVLMRYCSYLDNGAMEVTAGDLTVINGSSLGRHKLVMNRLLIFSNFLK